MQKQVSSIAWPLVFIASLGSLVFIFYRNHEFYQEFLFQSQSVGSYTIPRVAETKPAFIQIDFPDRPRLFSSNIGTRAYPLREVLRVLADNKKIPLIIRKGKVDMLGTVRGPWKIYHNDTLLNNSIDTLTITGGDTYTLRP